MRLLKPLALSFILCAPLLTSCSQTISEEKFCAKAIDLIVKYKQEKGLSLLGGVYFEDYSGITVFSGLEAEIQELQESDPVKFYKLGTDRAIMQLCGIEVK